MWYAYFKCVTKKLRVRYRSNYIIPGKDKILFILALLFCFSSCNLGNKRVISTYTITNTDFENSIIIDGTVEPIRFTNMLCPGNVDAIVTYLIDDGTYVEEGDIVCILEDNEQQTNYNNMKIELENAIAELSKVRADLKIQYALLEAQVKNNDVDTEIADLDSLQLKFATPIQKRIKELELERAYIQKANLQQKLDALDIINKSEIR